MAVPLNEYEIKLLDVVRVARSLRIDQAFLVNPGLKPKVNQAVIQYLYKNGYIFFSKERDYLLARPDFKPDKRMTDAMWPILRQITNIDTAQLYHPYGPSTIGMVKQKGCFEFVAANNEKELYEAAKELDERYKTHHYKVGDTYFQYVFLVKNEEAILDFPEEIKAPHVFGLLDYRNGLSLMQKPEISFYHLQVRP